MTPTSRDGTTPLDPDRRRPPPPHPGFAQLDIDLALDVCRRCRCLVPATEWARIRHIEYEQTVQLSGEVGERESGRPLTDTGSRHDPTSPDPKSPPTPLPGDHSRGGVGGSNQPTQAGAGPPPSDATVAPGVGPPAPGATEGSRPGVARESRPGREPTPDEAEQAAYEAWLNEQAARP